MIVDNIDTEERAIAHWLLLGVTPDVTNLESGISGSGNLPVGVLESTNGYVLNGKVHVHPPDNTV